MTLLQLVALAFSFAAHAQPSEPTLLNKLHAVQGALDGRGAFTQSIQKLDFAAITHEQLGNAIGELAQNLRDRNDAAMADELMSKWTQTQFSVFANFSDKDLGDHQPLLPWLEDFLQKMADKYGSIVFMLPIVKDVRTMNFAIPVVFSPKGPSWHIAGDNRIEYRKHFIPFANIVTYYAAYYGCIYVIQHEGMGQLKQLCGMTADKLRFLMGRYAAPQISDWIYKVSNTSSTARPFDFNQRRMVYTTSEDLYQAVKGNE